MTTTNVAYIGDEKWLTPREAAAYARVGQNLIRKSLATGELPGYMINGSARVSTLDLSRWVRAHPAAATAPFAE